MAEKKEKKEKNLQLLSRREVADLLGVNCATLRAIARNCAFIKPIRIGGQWRYRVSDLEKWLDKKKSDQ